MASDSNREQGRSLPLRSFARVSRLIGEEALAAIRSRRVLLLGLGGVGSWCAESLVRSGIEHITLVDADAVDVTNINRQLPATTSTVGRPKVVVMRERLLDINPEAEIEARQMFYDETTQHLFDLEQFDYVIDAIDSLSAKALLILNATAARRPRIYSSMGAALKIDPSRVAVAEFWKVKGCPLARALRQKFKRSGQMPRRKFQCVYSDELLQNLGPSDETCDYKAQINGALCHITAIFGLTLASLPLRHTLSAK